MNLWNVSRLLGQRMLIISRNCVHSTAYFRSGALKPKPEEAKLPLSRVLCTVLPGLFIGAAISKNVANFLEENDLFVPDDDDDDED